MLLCVGVGLFNVSDWPRGLHYRGFSDPLPAYFAEGTSLQVFCFFPSLICYGDNIKD